MTEVSDLCTQLLNKCIRAGFSIVENALLYVRIWGDIRVKKNCLPQREAGSFLKIY